MYHFFFCIIYSFDWEISNISIIIVLLWRCPPGGCKGWRLKDCWRLEWPCPRLVHTDPSHSPGCGNVPPRKAGPRTLEETRRPCYSNGRGPCPAVDDPRSRQRQCSRRVNSQTVGASRPGSAGGCGDPIFRQRQKFILERWRSVRLAYEVPGQILRLWFCISLVLSRSRCKRVDRFSWNRSRTSVVGSSTE